MFSSILQSAITGILNRFASKILDTNQTIINKISDYTFFLNDINFNNTKYQYGDNEFIIDNIKLQGGTINTSVLISFSLITIDVRLIPKVSDLTISIYKEDKEEKDLINLIEEIRTLLEMYMEKISFSAERIDINFTSFHSGIQTITINNLIKNDKLNIESIVSEHFRLEKLTFDNSLTIDKILIEPSLFDIIPSLTIPSSNNGSISITINEIRFLSLSINIVNNNIKIVSPTFSASILLDEKIIIDVDTDYFGDVIDTIKKIIEYKKSFDRIIFPTNNNDKHIVLNAGEYHLEAIISDSVKVTLNSEKLVGSFIFNNGVFSKIRANKQKIKKIILSDTITFDMAKCTVSEDIGEIIKLVKTVTSSSLENNNSKPILSFINATIIYDNFTFFIKTGTIDLENMMIHNLDGSISFKKMTILSINAPLIRSENQLIQSISIFLTPSLVDEICRYYGMIIADAVQPDNDKLKEDLSKTIMITDNTKKQNLIQSYMPALAQNTNLEISKIQISLCKDNNIPIAELCTQMNVQYGFGNNTLLDIIRGEKITQFSIIVKSGILNAHDKLDTGISELWKTFLSLQKLDFRFDMYSSTVNIRLKTTDIIINVKESTLYQLLSFIPILPDTQSNIIISHFHLAACKMKVSFLPFVLEGNRTTEYFTLQNHTINVGEINYISVENFESLISLIKHDVLKAINLKNVLSIVPNIRAVKSTKSAFLMCKTVFKYFSNPIYRSITRKSTDLKNSIPDI